MAVFAKCEQMGTAAGEMDKEAFRSCFIIERARVEQVYPGAFDFMKNGWEFFLMMLGLFLIYYYVIRDKVDEILGGKDNLETDDKKDFEFGKYVKEFGEQLWKTPQELMDKVAKSYEKKPEKPEKK
ncbi:MAG: hypothetical protein FWG18_02315, partial [Alphaproteobacteria bacterium]|nr:hypothetical protein [Alphaproteobacteria bacterium]